MEQDIPPSMSEESRDTFAGQGAASITEPSRPLAALSDDDLLRRLAELLTRSRRVEADLVVHIAEADARRLYAREAFPSMFAYCTKALHLSESEAYLRIAAARASREHPAVLAMLGDGRLHLTGIALLAPHLTLENRDTLLRRATHRSKREIEELIAEIAPRPDVPALMRRLPERALSSTEAATSTPSRMGNSVTRSPAQVLESPSGSASVRMSAEPASPSIPPEEGPVVISPEEASVSIWPHASVPNSPRPLPSPPAAVVQPLSPGRYKVQFTASAQLRDKLERLQALLRSQIPDGDLGAVVEVAVTDTLERLEARRFAATTRPRKSLSSTNTSPGSRYIPAAVRRAVRARDGSQCRFVDASGRRCGERHRLTYHHVYPFGVGGDHRPENIHLTCQRHNQYLAERDYGREAMARCRRAGT
jgi:hypothetical protein